MLIRSTRVDKPRLAWSALVAANHVARVRLRSPHTPDLALELLLAMMLLALELFALMILALELLLAMIALWNCLPWNCLHVIVFSIFLLLNLP